MRAFSSLSGEGPGVETLRRVARGPAMGFLSPEELSVVANDPATEGRMLLVRFHEGRILCPARLCQSEIVRREGDRGWLCRDVSIPSTDPIYRKGANDAS